MNGITAQLAALAIAGNYWLRGGELGRFWPDAAVFKWCKYVKFITRTGAHREENPYTDDYLSWLAKQKGEGITGFRMIYESVNRGLANDRMTAVFVGGGGHKMVECVHGNTADRWDSGWVASPPDAAGKVWEVKYARIAQDMPIAGQGDPHAAFGELEAALAAILRFAEKGDDDAKRFAPDFAAALTCLTSDKRPKRSFLFPDLECMIEDEGAKSMLAACQAAWVFGGMGSWNDQGSGEEYETVSENLFMAIMHAAAAATNSTFPR
jgi:hypothetical protein